MRASSPRQRTGASHPKRAKVTINPDGTSQTSKRFTMVVELLAAILSPFVSQVTEHFLDGRRDTVPVSELQRQVLSLLAGQRELEFEVTQARMAVLALSRYLAYTHQETFIL